MEAVAGIDRHAALPKFHTQTFEARALRRPAHPDEAAPAFGRKAVLYATCFVNYNNPRIGEATQAVLAKNGVATEVLYPECCGMPQMEQGELPRVAAKAEERRARAQALYRARLRYRRAHPVLRADAEIRMAAPAARR